MKYELQTETIGIPQSTSELLDELAEIKFRMDEIIDSPDTAPYVLNKTLKDKILLLRDIERLLDKRSREAKTQVKEVSLGDMIKKDPSAALAMIKKHQKQLKQLEATVKKALPG